MTISKDKLINFALVCFIFSTVVFAVLFIIKSSVLFACGFNTPPLGAVSTQLKH